MKIKPVCLIFVMTACALYSQEMRIPQVQQMQKMTKVIKNEALVRMITELEIT